MPVFFGMRQFSSFRHSLTMFVQLSDISLICSSIFPCINLSSLLNNILSIRNPIFSNSLSRKPKSISMHHPLDLSSPHYF
ncbi:hypothetical protein HanRHA438_Chr00c41g0856951 [Helianthus annuus]|nr:hypothetical protein HanHA89_Chr02g0057281 [Helianthus annuus]KAJ0777224.1 hypothetical protein HanLR1_Chr02g0054941 [Helianthus annuus]KAJ0805398.1 hypothetical protein HanPI659440_Chr02g0049531 [Helianthus annuus]KAJ0939929.1 hypothetical protein HanRHA438_Chr02g0066901 [Helianthus annuus]KAJ0951806.1 hypothetical protein HanPSC8_Chr02g0064721 [Helianthus annuus]